jgi:transcriptional/translational regulatory protein YebC/TACO1
MPWFDITISFKVEAADEEEAEENLDKLIDIAYELDDIREVSG